MLLAAINLSMWRCWGPRAQGPNPKSKTHGRHQFGNERNGLAKLKYVGPKIGIKIRGSRPEFRFHFPRIHPPHTNTYPHTKHIHVSAWHSCTLGAFGVSSCLVHNEPKTIRSPHGILTLSHPDLCCSTRLTALQTQENPK